MKPKIHPETQIVTVTCACGHSFQTLSTAKALKLEICSACHPFFTGKQKFIDTAGRVDRFKRKIESHAAKPEKTEKKPAAS